MTKKHLITCSVMVVLVIISTINICSVSSKDSENQAVKTASVYHPAPLFEIPKAVSTTLDETDEFSFADEALPLKDAVVKRRLKHTLHEHSFQCVGSDILQIKAQQLFPVIEPILKAYGIPDDFKYLPLVESGLCSGTSPKGARGVWQFMPGTARTYGLKVSKNIDERLDVRKATVAACRYIKDLYVEFNSWTLAAAAYNNGEIKLQKAINRQKEDNYFLMRLNPETAAYVYKIIAMKQIITDPARYGYKSYYKPSQLLAYN